MSLVHAQSLADTVNAIEDTFFFKRPASVAERRGAARWIAARQGLEGAYAAFPATTPRDRTLGGRTFTGEHLTNAACRHVFGEEACRALIRLNVREPGVASALSRATERMLGMLWFYERGPQSPFGRAFGTYCCGPCSVAFWRHLATGGLDNQEARLAAGIRKIRQHRDGTGKWRRFPFAYTVLTLLDLDLPAARAELNYAAPQCERLIKHGRAADVFAQRRLAVASRALQLIC